ncbi:MAG: hypothetical protein CL663_08535 [Bacteroidetes bacterium]|nr:hypothetical protein [Bacteroidota bacterium]MBC36070.1 hypothetical protein [Bacteroidota bacterium]
MKLESNSTEILRPAEEIFAFLSDFQNFEKLMPEQISNWSASPTHCSFEVNNMATIEMEIDQMTPCSYIQMNTVGKSPFPFALKTNIEKTDALTASVSFTLEAKLSPLMLPMVKKPLQQLVDVLGQKLKSYLESR